MLNPKNICEVFADMALTGLGTGEDNRREPIHRWFPFMPSFSSSLITKPLDSVSTAESRYTIFDPFVGCGTTAVAGHLLGHKVIGHEANEFMYRVSLGKLTYHHGSAAWEAQAKAALEKAKRKWQSVDISSEQEILRKCFTDTKLKQLVALRDIYSAKEISPKLRSLYFLVVSSLIPRCASFSVHPYVSWNHKKIAQGVFTAFEDAVSAIVSDMDALVVGPHQKGESQIFLHDSRSPNLKITEGSVDFVFTSPPYLNNYDYGEATKIFGYFWGLTNNWNEVTRKVRRKLVTSSTTCYQNAEYKEMTPSEMLGDVFKASCPKTHNKIVAYSERVRRQIKRGNRGKSFDILVPLYFRDMFSVLSETLRVLKPNHPILMVVGDSAPYGVHVPTDELLLDITRELGASENHLEYLRARGKKWPGLRFRHSRKLRESLLIIKK